MKTPTVKTMTFSIEGFTPYSPGKAFPYGLSKPKSVAADKWDEMNWTRRIHCDGADDEKGPAPNSLVYLPMMAFFGQTGCLFAAAKNRPDLKIDKKGLSSFVSSGMSLTIEDSTGLTPLLTSGGKPAMVKDFQRQSLFVPADGKGISRGGKGTRVWRNFPVIQKWYANVSILLLNEALHNADTMSTLAEEAGFFVGIGRFRPERGGFNGRFKVTNFKIS